jgi:two-component system, NarL family, response regulator DevR
MEQYRVFVVDDHELIRRGVRDLVATDDRLTVVGEAATAASAVEQIPRVLPDVALLDVRLPDGNGIEVCRDLRLRVPQVNCLILTAYDDDEALFDSILAGAGGYMLKHSAGTDLVEALCTVASGRSLLDPMVTAKVLHRLREGSEREERLGKLTDQERKILELIGEGMTNRQIAEQIHLAEKTVKNYVSNMLAKLGMERRTQAAAYAARLGDPRRE